MAERAHRRDHAGWLTHALPNAMGGRASVQESSETAAGTASTPAADGEAPAAAAAGATDDGMDLSLDLDLSKKKKKKKKVKGKGEGGVGEGRLPARPSGSC